jgi:toxin YhaV
MNNPLIINDWIILVHPLFIDQIAALTEEVEELKRKDSLNYRSKAPSKKLAAIFHLAFKQIPADPSLSEYRQGSTLGNENKHWFRVKFFQQYRLFFRYHLEKRIIIYAWVNDDSTKRAYDKKSDAYAVFRKMLINGIPPNNWDDLIKEANKSNSNLLMNKLSTSFGSGAVKDPQRGKLRSFKSIDALTDDTNMGN